MALPCAEQLGSSPRAALSWLRAPCEEPWNKGPLSATGELLLVSITVQRERAWRETGSGACWSRNEGFPPQPPTLCPHLTLSNGLWASSCPSSLVLGH